MATRQSPLRARRLASARCDTWTHRGDEMVDKNRQRHIPPGEAARLSVAPPGEAARLKVLYFLPDRGACGWYRMRQPAYWLNRIPGIEVRYFSEENWGTINEANTELLRWPNVIVCARLSRGTALGLIRDYNPNAAIVYDIDDELLNVPEENISEASFDEPTKECIRNYLASADLVTVSTPTLAERLKKYNAQIEVIPNCIPPEMMELKPIAKDHVRVGWAGSVTHVKDVEPAMEGLLMALDIIGYEKLRPVFMGFLGAKLAHRFHPQYTYYQKPVIIDYFYKALFGCALDIGLAPIRPHPFNQAKSAVKWYEYSAVGAATIASNVGPYQAEIESGRTGILVPHDSPEKWRDIIIGLTKDDTKRRTLVSNAKLWCVQNRDPRKWAKTTAETYQNLSNHKGTKTAKKNRSNNQTKAQRPGPLKQPSLVVGMVSWVPEEPEVDPHENKRLGDLMQCFTRILARLTWPNVSVKILDHGSCVEASAWIASEVEQAKARGLDVEVIRKIENMGIGPGMNFLMGLPDSLEADYFMKIDNDVIPPPGFDTIMMKAYLALEKRGEPIGMLSLDPQWGPQETFGTREDYKVVARGDVIHGHELNWLKDRSTAVGMCRLERASKYWQVGGHPDDLKYGTDQILADRFAAAGYVSAHIIPMISPRPGVKPVRVPLIHIGSTTEDRKAFKREELHKMKLKRLHASPQRGDRRGAETGEEAQRKGF